MKTMKAKAYSNRKPRRMLSGKIMFHTKYNRPMLKGIIQKRAKEIIQNILEDLGCEVFKIIVHPNYVFIQFSYPPKLSMAKIANKIKGKSSCLLRREFPELVNQCEKALWAPKYGIYT
jgi:putative transposase